MGFSRPEDWSGLPGPPPGDLPNPGIKPRFPELQVDSLPSEPPRKPPYLQFLDGALPPHPHPACLGHRDLLCGFFVQGYTLL